ncbi:MAG: hypothetical protein LBL07_11935 [Tannerella sp.]|jgi:hypothetical protein|nr:hypothetical protein [Tannerella sp.]
MGTEQQMNPYKQSSGQNRKETEQEGKYLNDFNHLQQQMAKIIISS